MGISGHARRGVGAAVLAIAVAGAVPGHAADERAGVTVPPVLPVHIELFGKPGFIVRDAVEGAIQHLGSPDCAGLIGELNDGQGRPLAWNLSERGMAPDVYLSQLRFHEGDGLAACEAGTTVATTVPNSRVIWVCGRRFARYFALDRQGGEAIIIHELLHSLGLGENPPSSAEITQLVQRRCGD